MRTETQLRQIAEQHPDDATANAAMKELRERFDKTYIWCEDCDGLVTKEKDCCMNRPYDPNEIIDLDWIT
jgi:hypothetical protein